jgi:S-formylglutathione hydrolase FrmB
MFERIFGDDGVAGTPDDLHWLIGQADPAGLPSLYVGCGTEDVLIDGNRAFVDACTGEGIPVTSSFGPGAHDWAYWDSQIQHVLAWLPLRTG